MVLIRELVAGSTRFNDLRRGVPRMSPTLLSRRLGELEEAGVLRREPLDGDSGHCGYILTEAGRDLAAVVEAMGAWGQKWVDADLSLANLDPALLMWDMRRNLDPSPMTESRVVIAFRYRDQPADRRDWWLIVEPGAPVDLCSVEPGFEVDLTVETDLRCMTEIWMGLTSVHRETSRDRLILTGDQRLAGTMQRWLGLSPFASQTKRRR
jgi:DNA-binding HxlR family transcriptional regulator